MKFNRIESKKDLIEILKKNNIKHQYLSFIDREGKEDFVYMVKYEENFYGEDCCGGYISYNKDKTWTREEIEESKHDMRFIEPFNDGVLYELDVFPTYKDFVKYPITNVEFLEEKDVLIKVINKNKRSFYDCFMK